MTKDRISGIEILSFEQALTSLTGYPRLDDVPRKVFRVLNSHIAATKGLSLEKACQMIEIRIGFSRNQVKAKLQAFQPLSADKLNRSA